MELPLESEVTASVGSREHPGHSRLIFPHLIAAGHSADEARREQIMNLLLKFAVPCVALVARVMGRNYVAREQSLCFDPIEQ